MYTVCNLNLHQASTFSMHESDSYFPSLLHQTHLLLSWICPFDRLDRDPKGTGPFTCTFQIQVLSGGSLCLRPEVMFMAETSPLFSKELDTNKKVSAVICKSLDIAKLCSTPQKQVPSIMGKHKTLRNRNVKEGMKPVFFNQ